MYFLDSRFRGNDNTKCIALAKRVIPAKAGIQSSFFLQRAFNWSFADNQKLFNDRSKEFLFGRQPLNFCLINIWENF
jgi:hypothetical protein